MLLLLLVPLSGIAPVSWSAGRILSPFCFLPLTLGIPSDFYSLRVLVSLFGYPIACILGGNGERSLPVVYCQVSSEPVLRVKMDKSKWSDVSEDARRIDLSI